MKFRSRLGFQFTPTPLMIIGRYISGDPIGIAGGLNTFNYSRENPINGFDPSGTDCTSANGTTTCITDAYNVSFPTPSNWNDFTSNTPNYHFYSTPAPVNPQMPETDLQNWLVAHPTVSPAQDPASPTGQRNDATPDVGGVCSINLSPVKSYTVINQVTGKPVVVNVTQPWHILSSGIVVREVDGSTINTWGEGISLWQSFTSGPLGDLTQAINGVWAGKGGSPNVRQ